MISPGYFLRRVVAGLRAGTLSRDDALRVAEQIELYLMKPREVTLDEAFGVKPGDGGEHWLTTEARDRRASALRSYCSHFSASVMALVDAVRQYRPRWQARDRRLSEMPAAYRGTPREFLFAAFRENALLGDMPGSAKQLRRII